MKSTTLFPQNVHGFDGVVMTEPPAERTKIGYFTWVDTDDPSNYRRILTEHYVLPDGSAEIVRKDEPFQEGRDKPGVVTPTEYYPPGTWDVMHPMRSFGSGGGLLICNR
jgi:hypothetical protein